LWGFPVAADKRPCSAHGHKDAVDRRDRAYELFMRHPGARLIGVAMGVRSMLLGIDVDPAGLGWYRENFARFPVTLAHRTPRGGFHLIYQLPRPGELGKRGGVVPVIGCPRVINGRPALAHGVDVMAEGGSLIWAPSPGYTVVHDAPIAKLPRWIVRRLCERAERAAAPVEYRGPLDNQLRGIRQFIEHSRQGERNEVAFWGACRAGEIVRAGKLSYRDAIGLVVQAAVAAGLPRREALASAKSGVRTGMGAGS
jgi:hypothetical protein